MSSTGTKALQCPNCGANAEADSVRCGYCRAVLTVTACPACFGAIFQGMKYCPNCGAPVEREIVRSDRQLTCPRCSRNLTPARIGSARIDECSNCGGIWLNTDTFQKICADREQQEQVLVFTAQVQTTGLQPEQTPGRMYIPCPECGGLMQRKNFSGCSGVVVDWCKPHGTWFDRLELQQIVNFIQSGGFRKARAREMDQLQAERRRLQGLQQELNLDQLREANPLSWHDPENDDTLLDALIAVCKKIF